MPSAITLSAIGLLKEYLNYERQRSSSETLLRTQSGFRKLNTETGFTIIEGVPEVHARRFILTKLQTMGEAKESEIELLEGFIPKKYNTSSGTVSFQNDRSDNQMELSYLYVKRDADGDYDIAWISGSAEFSLAPTLIEKSTQSRRKILFCSWDNSQQWLEERPSHIDDALIKQIQCSVASFLFFGVPLKDLDVMSQQ